MIQPRCWAPDGGGRTDALGDPAGSVCPASAGHGVYQRQPRAVKRLTPSATGHLVFCAGAAFDKTRLLNVWQGCVLLIRTDQQERIVRAIQEQFYVDSRKSAMSAYAVGSADQRCPVCRPLVDVGIIPF